MSFEQNAMARQNQHEMKSKKKTDSMEDNVKTPCQIMNMKMKMKMKMTMNETNGLKFGRTLA